MELANKIALVTGGTKGIGAATALELATRGADVAVVARHLDDGAQQVRVKIEKLGQRCLLIAADMGKPEDATRCAQQTAQQLGAVDVLVHSAGGGVRGGLLELTPEAKHHNIENRIQLHREGTPEQVASLIRELACNDYVTGETFTVDGGLTMRIC